MFVWTHKVKFVQGVTMTEWSEARLKYVWSKEGQVLRGLIPVKHPPFGGGGGLNFLMKRLPK